MTTNQPRSGGLKVGHMTYLNSEVFYRKLPGDSCELFPMPPRAMAVAVESGQLHAGPLPIAEVFRLGDKVRSLGNMGVASDGPAMSVFLFSDSPVRDLAGARIGVTSHTATSIQLLRVLLNDHWNVSNCTFVEQHEKYDALLVIGDPALEMLASNKFELQYDLGEEWKLMTGLPFVFAEWVIRSDAPADLANTFEAALLDATYAGIDSITEICEARESVHMNKSAVSAYVKNFTYFLGESERSGQAEFAKRLEKLPAWRPSVAESETQSIEGAISRS